MTDSHIPLVPVDLITCQAEKRDAHGFMVLGPTPRFERCKARARWVITERQAAADGSIGAMAVCDDCLAHVPKEMLDTVDKREIPRPVAT